MERLAALEAEVKADADAQRAQGMKHELTRAPKQGDKSWVKSGLASLLLGPLGWLYAGSWREAIPASAGWVLLAGIASKIIPMFLLMPVMMVVLPLSGIAGRRASPWFRGRSPA